jgi:hypothetical protein
MEWLLNLLRNIVGQGISSVGERMGRNMPTGRPIDAMRARRRLKGEMAELYTLYTRLCQYATQAEERCSELCRRVVLEVLDTTPDELTNPYVNASVQLCRNILRYEGYFPLPEIDFSQELPLGEIWELSKVARRQLAFHERGIRREEIGEVLKAFLDKLHAGGLPNLSVSAGGDEGAMVVPLVSLHHQPANAIEGVIRSVFRKPEDDGLFSRLGEALLRNLLLASGIDPDKDSDSDKQPVMPTAARDKTPGELVQLYLDRTPFTDFFDFPVPFTIPDPARFEHTYIVE